MEYTLEDNEREKKIKGFIWIERDILLYEYFSAFFLFRYRARSSPLKEEIVQCGQAWCQNAQSALGIWYLIFMTIQGMEAPSACALHSSFRVHPPIAEKDGDRKGRWRRYEGTNVYEGATKKGTVSETEPPVTLTYGCAQETFAHTHTNTLQSDQEKTDPTKKRTASSFINF